MTPVLETPEAAAPDSTEAPLSGNLSWLLSQASHALATEMTARLEAIGIYPRGYCVLKTALDQSLTQSEIASMIGLDKTTMVVTVDELERAGLAERRPSATDRRARVINVTAAGKRKLKQAGMVVDQIQDEVLATLPPDERDTLLSALTTLVAQRLSTPMECGRAPRRRD
jgi:MarR family transcriptional regulator, transcriptional regulator for hemolysin